MSGLFAKPFRFFARFFRGDVHGGLKLIIGSVLLVLVTALPWLVYAVAWPEYWRGGGAMWPALVMMTGYVLGQLGVVVGGIWFLWSFFFGGLRDDGR
ncbi:hypothetical protein KQH82_10585 [bacterium]|nr:hypothetical protein [bacterium]